MRSRCGARLVSIGVSFLLLVLAWARSASAQDLSRPGVRAAVVARLEARAVRDKAAAVRFARAAGLPVRGRAAGRTYELVALRNGRPLYHITDNVNAAISTAADLIRNTSPFDVNGAGLTVGIWDGGDVRPTHQEFGGRVTVMDGLGEDSHSTHVAGTIGASGDPLAGCDPAAKGMAPSVNMDSYDWNSDYAEMTARGASYPGEPGTIYVSNHSYGFIVGWTWTTWSGFYAYHWTPFQPWPDNQDDLFGQYDAEAEQVDTLAYQLPYYLVFNSSGNDRSDNPAVGERVFYVNPKSGQWKRVTYDPTEHPPGDGVYKAGYDTVSSLGVSKNIMTVGAVTDAVSGVVRDPGAAAVMDFSCWGPADDGRLKPDIVANGEDLYSTIADDDTSYDTYSGTSMSSPNAVGSAILLVEYFGKQFPGHAMRASTLKALIIHTADDLGNPGPDYAYGWGLINAKAAADIITDYRTDTGNRKIVEGRLTPAKPSDGYTITWDGTSAIRATLSWTDPPGAATTVDDDPTAKLVNDLDLVVTDPVGTILWPYVLDPANPSQNATTGENNLDNVEQVYVASPGSAGDYTVTVDYDGALMGGEQYYSLIVTGGEQAVAAPAPTISSITPNFEETGQTVAVSISGAGFLLGAEVKLTKLSQPDIAATGEQVTPEFIKATLDLAGAAIGEWDVVVTNPDASSATLANGFVVRLLTPVVMGEVSARSVGLGALVEWTTQSELENSGFDVLRRPASGGRWTRATARPVPGRLTDVGLRTYRYLDLVRPGRYEYRVETISTGGVRERYPAAEAVRVDVSPGEAAGALGELSSLLAGRAGDLVARWRGGGDAFVRRVQLACPPSLRSAPRPGAGMRAAGRSSRPTRKPAVRLLSSTSALARRKDRAADWRPSPGDVRVRTRGDGIFFVPAGLLPAAPQSVALVAGGAGFRPLEAGRSGVWFFAAGYLDCYTDMNSTFVTRRRGGAPRTSTAPRGREAPGGDAGTPGAPGWLYRKKARTVATATARAEKDERFLLGAVGAPDPWFYSVFLRSGWPERRVDVSIAEPAGGPATLRVALFAYSYDDRVEPDHELIVSVNDRAVASFLWDGRGYEVLEVGLPEGAVEEGSNVIGLLAPELEALPRGHGVALDYVEIEYARNISVAAGPLLFEVEEPCVVEVAGLAAPELRVAEVHSAGGGERVGLAFRELGPGRWVARFFARGGGVYYAARPVHVRAPEDVSAAVIAQVPPGTNYLAVGPESLREEAMPLVEARGGAYVSLEAAVDTFGCGRYGAGAIARLVRRTRPRYVLLVGDNSYDYLDREGRGVDPMVPSIVVKTRFVCATNADALYGDLDGDGSPDIPVGRLPVRTGDELRRLVDKTLGRAARGSVMEACLVADAPADGDDFAAAQDIVAQEFSEVDWTKLYLGVHGDGAFIRSRLTRAVNSGAEFVLYQGHGSSRRLGRGETILDLGEAARWSGAPVVYLSTCWGAYIQKNTESPASMAEALLRSEGGAGAVAVIGSTTASMQSSQEALLGDFLHAALSDGASIGEALVFAQKGAVARARALASEETRLDILDTVRCYAVLGDPAARLVPRARE